MGRQHVLHKRWGLGFIPPGVQENPATRDILVQFFGAGYSEKPPIPPQCIPTKHLVFGDFSELAKLCGYDRGKEPESRSPVLTKQDRTRKIKPDLELRYDHTFGRNGERRKVGGRWEFVGSNALIAGWERIHARRLTGMKVGIKPTPLTKRDRTDRAPTPTGRNLAKETTKRFYEGEDYDARNPSSQPQYKGGFDIFQNPISKVLTPEDRELALRLSREGKTKRQIMRALGISTGKPERKPVRYPSHWRPIEPAGRRSISWVPEGEYVGPKERELVSIANFYEQGRTALEIARVLGIKTRTVQRKLAYLLSHQEVAKETDANNQKVRL